MQPRERHNRITPLPPPESESPDRRDGAVARPWLPALLAVAGLVVFAFWLAGTGIQSQPPGQGAAPSPSRPPLSPDVAAATTTSAPAAPPTSRPSTPLNELIPGLTEDLIIFGRYARQDVLATWRPTDGAPSLYSLSGANILTAKPEPAALNLIAYETESAEPALYLGGWQRQDPVFVGTRGFAWDPAGSATLAWVGRDQVTGATSLYMRLVDGTIQLVAPLPDGSRLLTWTQIGLIMSERRGGPISVVDEAAGTISLKVPTVTVVRSPAGESIASAMAQPLKASAVGTIVALGTADAFAAAGIDAPEVETRPPADLVVMDLATDPARLTYEVIPQGEPLVDGAPLFSANGRWSITADGNWAGRTANLNSVATLVVQGLRTESVHEIPLSDDATHLGIGFLPDSTRFVSWSPTTQELSIVNWLTGERSTIPYVASVWFESFFLRP